MNTFVRKLKLSFLAMLCGWIACNIVWWIAILRVVRFDDPLLQEPAIKVFYLSAGLGNLVLIAWLVIFLPVDLIVPEHSVLRRPLVAAICGLVAGSCVILIPWAWSIWENDSLHSCLENIHSKTWLFALSPGITGMVAAYVRSRDYNPSLKKP